MKTICMMLLKKKRIAGAALDVFPKEPPENTCVSQNVENCIVTPHLGASTEEAQIEVAVEAAQILIDALKRRSDSECDKRAIDFRSYAADRKPVCGSRKENRRSSQYNCDRSTQRSTAFSIAAQSRKMQSSR